MRKLKFLTILIILFTIIAFPVSAINIPTPTNDFYVNDFAGVLSDSTKQLIMQNSVAIQQATGAQIVVVTVNSLDGNVIDDYALNILRSWGIGDSKANNGLLILLAVDDRKSRIEVGYGLEGALPDGKTGWIQDDYMLPYFIAENYDEGIKNGYLAVLQEVATEYSLDISALEKPYPQINTDGQTTTLSPLAKTIIGILIVLLLIIDWTLLGGKITRSIFYIFLIFGGRGGRGGGSSGGGFSGGGGSGGGGGSSRGW